jgi:hypothetical protein
LLTTKVGLLDSIVDIAVEYAFQIWLFVKDKVEKLDYLFILSLSYCQCLHSILFLLLYIPYYFTYRSPSVVTNVPNWGWVLSIPLSFYPLLIYYCRTYLQQVCTHNRVVTNVPNWGTYLQQKARFFRWGIPKIVFLFHKPTVMQRIANKKTSEGVEWSTVQTGELPRRPCMRKPRVPAPM